jgi:hypothetical protein
MPEVKVDEIETGKRDEAGNFIRCVYFRKHLEYAIYRTDKRVAVQYADNPAIREAQRHRIARLTPLRGQINALINGWRSAGLVEQQEGDESGQSFRRERWRLPWAISENDQRRRADRYDRRVADAIVTALDHDDDYALALLGEVKNDIVSERTSLARGHYLIWTFAACVLLIVIATTSARLPWVGTTEARHIFTGLAAGTVGAFYSIAIGLRGRDIAIDLQNRENTADALLRVLIGTLSGGLLIALLLTKVVIVASAQITDPEAGADIAATDVKVFVLAFIAGFFERLVPSMLASTNLGTKVPESPNAGLPPARKDDQDKNRDGDQGEVADGDDVDPDAGRDPSPDGEEPTPQEAGGDEHEPGSDSSLSDSRPSAENETTPKG